MRAMNIDARSFGLKEHVLENRNWMRLMSAVTNRISLLICLMAMGTLGAQAQINNPGTFSISGSTSVDVGETKTYTLNSSNGTGISFITWWVNNMGTKISETQTSVTIQWNTAGTGEIQAQVTDNTVNENQYVVDAPNVTVATALPPATPPADPGSLTIQSSSCGGAILDANGTPPPFVLWYWQGLVSNGTSSIQTSATSYSVNTTGTYYLRAYNTHTQLWSTGSSSVNVNIEDSVGPVTVTGISTRCKEADVSTFNASANNATVFTWTISPSAAGTIDANGDVAWSSNFSGVAFITAKTGSIFCGFQEDTKEVTVYQPVGNVTMTGDFSTRCQDSETVDFNASATGANSYTWSISPSNAGSISSSGSVDWSNTFSGIATITVAASGVGNCRSAIDSEVITITPFIGPMTITGGTSSRCQAGDITDFDVLASNATSFNWSISPSAAGNINNAGVVSWSNAFNGQATISVTASNSCFDKDVSKTVTVRPTIEATTISGDFTRCQGTSITDFNASAAYATNYSWSISPSSAGLINASTGVVNWSDTFNGTATITVVSSAINSCNTTTDTKAVTVNPAMGLIAITDGVDSRCQNDGITNFNTTNSTATDFAWSISPATAGDISNSGLVTWSGTFSGQATISVIASNSCSSSSDDKTVTVKPKVGYTAISGDQTLCINTGTTDYNASATHATIFDWSISPTNAGAINSSGLVTWSSTYFGTATISVVSSNADNCNQTTGDIEVVVTGPVGQAVIVNPLSSRCQGDGLTDFDAEAIQATRAIWTVNPTNAGSINGMGVIYWSDTFTGEATITATLENNCSSSQASFTVDVIETFDEVTITGNSLRCRGADTGSYSVSAGVTSSNWSISPASAGSINSSGLVTWDSTFSGTATISVDATNGCGSATDTHEVIVVAGIDPVTIIGGLDERCQEVSTTNFDTNSTNAEDYNWSISPVAAGSVNDTGLVSWSGAFSGTATISVSASNICGATTDTHTVTIHQAVSSAAITGGVTTRWQGGGTTNFNVSPANAAITNWSISPVSAGSISTSGTVTWSSGFSGIATISVSVSDLCNVHSNSRNVTVVALPVIATTGDLNLCELGQIVTLSLNRSYDSYIWKRDGVAVGNNSTFVAKEAGTYTVVVTVVSESRESAPITVTGDNVFNLGDRNYVVSTDILVAGMNTDEQINDLTIDDRSVAVNFLDGLGRPWQSVSIEASPDKRHIVQPFVYDEIGRQTKQYLPYVADDCNVFQINPVGIDEADYVNSPQYQFYQTTPDVAHDTKPFALSILEYSPLNRALKQGAPGLSWQPAEGSITDHVIRSDYATNTTEDLVQSFNMMGDNVAYASASGYYDPTTLFKTSTFDEDQNEIVEFTNKSGQVVLKRVGTGIAATPWAETYYVYGNRSDLRVVLPPEAVQAIEIDQLNDALLNKWAFQYKYDSRNRMTDKRVPGAGWVYMIYDPLDRVIGTQDAVQRSNNGTISFTKYDALGRVILTGSVSNGLQLESATELQEAIDPYFLQVDFYESVGTDILGYTRNAIPRNNNEDIYETAIYYDDYSNLPSDFSFVYVSELGNGSYNTEVKGQVVGTQTKLLDGSNIWLKSIVYYDDRYRVIQTQTENYLGGIDRVSIRYDFAGRVLETMTTHDDGTPVSDVLIKEGFIYDHASRLLEATHQVNNDPEITLVKNEYNALGELIDKKLHSVDAGTNFEQSVDYRYNIRGWLTNINDAGLQEADGDYFGMELGYDKLLNGVWGNARFNGNINGIKWSNFSKEDGLESAYRFVYDDMNRLIAANYREKQTSWGNPIRFDVPSIKYDLNGNINILKRHDTDETTLMDHLIYSYDGNQLTSVTDNGNDNVGFKDGNIGSPDYTYDLNGNMTSDANKDITAITYNKFNLPETITFTEGREINYLYDAAGIKLSKRVVESQSTTAYNVIHESDFSSGLGGWLTYKGVTQPNWDYAGETDVAKVVSNGVNGLHRFQKNVTSPVGDKVRVKARIYLPSTNTRADGIQIQVGFSNTVRSQIYTATDGWISIDYTTDVAPTAGYTFFYMKDGSSDTFLGSNNDYFFIKDVEISNVPAGTTEDIATTDYVGGFIYEDGVLQQFAHAEGRVRRKETGDFVYDYYLKDHLGNTRVTFSADKPETVYRATMEQELATDEESYFLNIENLREINVAANKTGSDASVNGNEVVRLNGNDPNRRLGPGKMLAVAAGDKVDLEVYGYYSGTPGTNSPIANLAFAALIGNAFGGSATGTEGQQAIQNGFENNLSVVVPSTGVSENADIKAYLNYILFNGDFEAVDAGFVRVDQGVVDGSHRLLQLNDIAIEQSGFLYVYTSNEGDVDFNVYFDELEIAHTSGGILQEDHYYPFGMNIDALSNAAPLSRQNSFKYNGKEEQSEFDLNWYDYGARMYNSVLGRWNGIDSKSDLYHLISPYAYTANDPISLIDPDGKTIVNPYKNKNSKEYKTVQKAIAVLEQSNPELYGLLSSASIEITVSLRHPGGNLRGKAVANKSLVKGTGFKINPIMIGKEPLGFGSGTYWKSTIISDDFDLVEYQEFLAVHEGEKIFDEDEPIFYDSFEIIIDPTKGDQEIAELLAHEGGHVQFYLENPFLALVWGIIGDSANLGHDKYNPGGKLASSQEEASKDYFKNLTIADWEKIVIEFNKRQEEQNNQN